MYCKWNILCRGQTSINYKWNILCRGQASINPFIKGLTLKIFSLCAISSFSFICLIVKVSSGLYLSKDSRDREPRFS